MNINIFIALSSSAKNAVNTRLRWNTERDGKYTGPVSDTEHKIFRRMADHATAKGMWKPATFAGKTWHLYSLTFDKPSRQLKKALNYLTANRKNVSRVMGAWFWDSRQVGTKWNADKTAVTGTPTYPIPSQLVKFMPGSVLADLNLEQGMEPRRFV